VSVRPGGVPLALQVGQHLGLLEVGAAAHLVVGEQAAPFPLVDGLGANVEQSGGPLHNQ